MLRFTMLAVVFISVAWKSDAIGQGTENDLPEIGTWEITIGGSQAAQPFKARMSVVRREGNRVLGVMEWSPSGSTKTLELFAATREADGDIRFDGREEHTLVPTMFPTRYRAQFGGARRLLTGFISTGLGTTGVSGTVRWISSDVPTYAPALEASLQARKPLPQLYQCMSANYVLDGLNIHVGADLPYMREAAKSQDAHIRTLAQTYVVVQELLEQSLARTIQEAQEWAMKDLERRQLASELLVKSFGSDSSLNPVIDLFNSIGIRKAFDQRRAKFEMACVQVAYTTRVRNEIIAMYRQEHAGKIGSLKGQLKAGFKSTKSAQGMMTFRNNSGKDLHHVSFLTRMTVDQGRVTRYYQESKEKELVAGLLLVGLGIEAKNILATNNFRNATEKYFRLDKGTPVFVPLWPKGSVVEVPLASTEDLRMISQAADAWVSCDEGQTEIALDIDEVITRLENERQRK